METTGIVVIQISPPGSMSSHWGASKVPMGCQWRASGVPIGCQQNASGVSVRLEHSEL